MFNLKSVLKTKEIEFLCSEEDYGVIPEPYPARKLMPEWFKQLPPKIDKKNVLENSTIKRCAPFLDAMSIGWIIPLAADVEIVSNNDASGVEYKWTFYKKMIENHSEKQISTSESPNPNNPKPPLKFLNYWKIKVPEGYSVLFVPPINRTEFRFQCISGLVDGEYNEFINFPFFFLEKNYTGIIRAGTPLVQAIVIKKEEFETEARTMNKKDIEDLELTRRRRKSHESYYRDKLWRRMK